MVTQSCSNSTIATTWIVQDVYCYGDRSCANSDITIHDKVFLYGHLSGFNTKFYGYDPDIIYHFVGFSSGYNATIYCDTDNSCNIKCYSNGCDNLSLQCINGNDSSCIFYKDCRYAQYDENNCPSGYKIISADFDEMPSILNVTSAVSSLKNSYSPCNKSYVNCVDYNDSQLACNGFIDTTLDNPSSICCTGYQSCKSVNNITAVVDNTTTGYKPAAIRCDGYQSCYEVPSSGFILSKPAGAGNIYATGYQSIGGSSTAYKATIETSSEYDIICSGYHACEYQYIRNGNNLYCTGCKITINIKL